MSMMWSECAAKPWAASPKFPAHVAGNDGHDAAVGAADLSKKQSDNEPPFVTWRLDISTFGWQPILGSMRSEWRLRPLRRGRDYLVAPFPCFWVHRSSKAGQTAALILARFNGF
jgi:hypothetical protein